MFPLEILFAIIPAIIIFIYGIDNFSKEIQKAIGTQFASHLKWATKNKIRSTIFGTTITAITQSSAATTLIAIGLVNAGAITFSQSLGIIFGANIGTTLTAQLVALNLMQFAQVLIIIGFVLSLLKTKYKVFGKPLFYLGLILFALNLISISIAPLKTDPLLLELLTQTSIIPIGIIIGFLVTNLFQSSTVTTGLVVILAQNGLLGLNEAIPILLGANIGTTILALIISSRMDSFAKRAAIAHFLFNVIGTIIIIPLISLIILIIELIGGNTAQQVANTHLLFNVLTTIILLIFFKQFQMLVEKIVPTTEKEILLQTNNLENIAEKNNNQKLKLIEKELKDCFEIIKEIFNQTNVILFSNKITDTKIPKLNSKIKFIHDEIKIILAKMFSTTNKKEIEQILLLTRTSSLCDQISFSGKKLGDLIIFSKENNLEFSSEGKQDIDECLSELNINMNLLKENFPNFNKKSSIEMAKNGALLRTKITKSYEEYLKRLATGQTKSGSLFAEALLLLQDIESKIREIRKICEKNEL